MFTTIFPAHLQNSAADFFANVETLVRNDWQLQASIVGMCILAVLILTIQIEWRKHEPSLTNLHRRDEDKCPSGTVSDIKLMKLDSFNKYDYEKIQQYPDEDPLTFVKKRI